jgi:hypothetical protein
MSKIGPTVPRNPATMTQRMTDLGRECRRSDRQFPTTLQP